MYIFNEFAKSLAMRACVPKWSMCQRGLHANVLACQRGLCANVPKACQLIFFTCQRANKCDHVPSGVPKGMLKGMAIFQTFLLRNAKENFYTLLLYKKFHILLDIILIHIMCICIIT